MAVSKIVCGVFIICMIIILYLTYSYGYNCSDMNNIHGFWNSTAEFNKTAGLHLFSIYIGNKDNGTYSSYILMIEDDVDRHILVNEPVHFNLSSGYTNAYGLLSTECREFKMIFNDIETTLLPKYLTMRYYPSTCKIILFDDLKVYAVLYKNPELSELEKISNERDKDSNNFVKEHPITTDIESI